MYTEVPLKNMMILPEGMDNWSKHAKSFGLGNYLGYDMPSGQKGLIPDSELIQSLLS